MTELVVDNVIKPSISPKYHQEKSLEQTFSERALFVFNINYGTTEEELRNIFFKYGPAKVKLMMNEQTQKNQGYAFIEYMDSNNAKEAVKNLNGYPLQDTKLKVQFNTKQPPWYANSYNRRQNDNPPSNSIYVRNLDNSISSDDLDSHFSRFGPVKVSLVIDHVTKRNKGYAFVDFATIEEATTAIKQTNGVMFYGRQLHVEFSNRGSNLDNRKSESVSSLNSEEDDNNRLRVDRERMEESLEEKKMELEDAKAAGCEDSIQTVREGIWRLQDEIARIKLAEEYPQPKSRSRSREDKRKKKRRSDEENSYYSDERENTPGLERPYTPTSFGSRRSHHRGSISSNSSQGDDGYLEYRVFVGGINHLTTPDTFKAVFSKFGKISSYFLKWDKTSGRNKGFGFVSYDTSDQMENLLATHKESPIVIDNHVVNIKRVFPDSHVSPFPLNIPPMLCRGAPHFTDPPTYCDEKNPLPDDPKTVEFFYNLGIHHYNLLRINVYHWNLLFPGNMFGSGQKMDSTPPTRQPSPALPTFPTQNLPVFQPMEQHRTAHIPPHPMMGTPIPHRNMFAHQTSPYPRQPMPFHHDMMNMQNKIYNNNVNNRSHGNHHYNNNNNNNNKQRGMHNNYHNNNNNYHNNYHSNYQNNNNSYHGNLGHNNNHNIQRSPMDNLQHPVRLQQPDRNVRNHIEHRQTVNKQPEKVSNGSQQVSFSPTNFSPTNNMPFSVETFSPSKVTNSPAHSSPPGQAPEETQNNSSYGSHEDTLTYESGEQATDQGYNTISYQASLHSKPINPPPQQNVAAQQQQPPNIRSSLSQTNLLQDLALSPPLQARPLDRSRSSSGSYNESLADKGNATCTMYNAPHPEKSASLGAKQHVQPNMANLHAQQQQQQHHVHQPPIVTQHQQPNMNTQHHQSRHQAPRYQQEKHHKQQESAPPPHPQQISKENIEMYLRNFPSANPNFHTGLAGPYPDYTDKGQHARPDARSPHGLPPPGYNPLQFLNLLQLPQMPYLPRGPGMMPHLQQHPMPHSQSAQPRYNSPTPSEDESDQEETRQ